MKHCHLWQNAWKTGYQTPLELTFPDSWDVTMQEMACDSWRPLTRAEMQTAINYPLGMPPIAELARSGREALIIFDDLSRGTQTQPLAEIVLEELEKGGIGPDHVRFLCALGTHGALTRADFAMKLGEEIVSRYPVYNHNAFFGNVQIGTDRFGVPVEINPEFLACDVRIGIGSCSPHLMNGYGGGGKLLFPGIASLKTTCRGTHARAEYGGQGNPAATGFRRDVEEMTRMAGAFFKIDAILNARTDTVALFAGDPIEEHYAAIEAAAQANAMPFRRELSDIVIANGNAKFNESAIAAAMGHMQLKKGGALVMVNFCPTGEVVHYGCGSFGTNRGGPCRQPHEARPGYPNAKKFIYYSPYPQSQKTWMGQEVNHTIFCRTWEEVLRELEDWGPGTSVSVLSDSSIGYFPDLISHRSNS